MELRPVVVVVGSRHTKMLQEVEIEIEIELELELELEVGNGRGAGGDGVVACEGQGCSGTAKAVGAVVAVVVVVIVGGVVVVCKVSGFAAWHSDCRTANAWPCPAVVDVRSTLWSKLTRRVPNCVLVVSRSRCNGPNGCSESNDDEANLALQ